MRLIYTKTVQIPKIACVAMASMPFDVSRDGIESQIHVEAGTVVLINEYVAEMGLSLFGLREATDAEFEAAGDTAIVID